MLLHGSGWEGLLAASSSGLAALLMPGGHSQMRTFSSAAVLARRVLPSERRRAAKLVTGPECPWTEGTMTSATLIENAEHSLTPLSGVKVSIALGNKVNIAQRKGQHL